ncbi:MAG: lipoprotein [Moritella sp.]|uniref:lipoprotein n=1 Tax=Moritella sp. TaxID=78556 RepID=UPI0025F26040|nr:lipoprotein [Moritella sp.]NQZ91239.1 lipoprotein [Moritella sp.]
MKKTILLALTVLALAACSTTDTTDKTAKPLPILPSYSNSCPDERPQMCTMDYRPVCGTTEPGELKTFSNACGACADVTVRGYSEGECQ